MCLVSKQFRIHASIVLYTSPFPLLVSTWERCLQLAESLQRNGNGSKVRSIQYIYDTLIDLPNTPPDSLTNVNNSIPSSRFALFVHLVSLCPDLVNIALAVGKQHHFTQLLHAIPPTPNQIRDVTLFGGGMIGFNSSDPLTFLLLESPEIAGMNGLYFEHFDPPTISRSIPIHSLSIRTECSPSSLPSFFVHQPGILDRLTIFIPYTDDELDEEANEEEDSNNLIDTLNSICDPTARSLRHLVVQDLHPGPGPMVVGEYTRSTGSPELSSAVNLDRFTSLTHLSLRCTHGPTISFLIQLASASPALRDLDFLRSRWNEDVVETTSQLSSLNSRAISPYSSPDSAAPLHYNPIEDEEDRTLRLLAESKFPENRIVATLGRFSHLRYFHAGWIPTDDHRRYDHLVRDLQKLGITFEWSLSLSNYEGFWFFG